MKYWNIIPECYVDTNLISTLLGAEVNHQKGCNTVANVLQDKNTDRFAVGIIDYDKRKPGYIDEFSPIVQYKHLRLFKHKTLHHYFITIEPAIEKLILDSAKELNVNLNKYGLPNTVDSLTKFTKKNDANKNKTFTSLFNELQKCEELKKLQEVLTYLLQNTYNAKEEEIQQIFMR